MGSTLKREDILHKKAQAETSRPATLKILSLAVLLSGRGERGRGGATREGVACMTKGRRWETGSKFRTKKVHKWELYFTLGKNTNPVAEEGGES